LPARLVERGDRPHPSVPMWHAALSSAGEGSLSGWNSD
jgi:hypothetical protein